MTMTERPERTQEERAEVNFWVERLNGIGLAGDYLSGMVRGDREFRDLPVTQDERDILALASRIVSRMLEHENDIARAVATRIPEVKQAILD